MSNKSKSYSAKFKAEVGLAIIREDASLAELSSRYGVPSRTMRNWKNDIIQQLPDIFSNKKFQHQADSEQKIKRLHAKIGELTMERDFLEQASRRLGVLGGKR